jgi:hypothetical protein
MEAKPSNSASFARRREPSLVVVFVAIQASSHVQVFT